VYINVCLIQITSESLDHVFMYYVTFGNQHTDKLPKSKPLRIHVTS